MGAALALIAAVLVAGSGPHCERVASALEYVVAETVETHAGHALPRYAHHHDEVPEERSPEQPARSAPVCPDCHPEGTAVDCCADDGEPRLSAVMGVPPDLARASAFLMGDWGLPSSTPPKSVEAPRLLRRVPPTRAELSVFRL